MAAASRRFTTFLLGALMAALVVGGLPRPAAAALPPIDCNVNVCVTGNVPGDVSAGPGQALRITNATIGGNVTANGATEVIICGTHVNGVVTIVGTTGIVLFGGGPDCAGNTTGDDVIIQDNRGGVTAVGNGASGDIIVRHNSAPVTVNNNTANGQIIVVPPTYNALTPARILDTRSGLLVGDGYEDKIPPGTTIDVQVNGRGGVPANGVGWVVLNVTVTEPTEPGFLTLWATGTPRPATSNLNFTPGQTVANLVLVKVGGNGKVSVFNSAGATHIIADVQGFIPSASDFGNIAPARILDTRPGGLAGDGLDVPLGPNSTFPLQVTGRGGVPAGGVRAVVLNVTATQGTNDSFLTLFPNGAARPNSSNVNFGGGQTVPNLVIALVGNNGRVNIYNAFGSVNVIVDVVGWMSFNTDYGALTPSRLLDTRPGLAPDDGNDVPLPAGGTRDVLVLGRGGVPTTGVGAVVVNLTITGPTDTGFITLWPAGTARPTVSNLNYIPGLTWSNLAIVPVGADGKISVYNHAGFTHVVLDIQGWFPPA